MKKFIDVKKGEKVFVYDYVNNSVRDYTVDEVTSNNSGVVTITASNKEVTSKSSTVYSFVRHVSGDSSVYLMSYSRAVLFTSCNNIDYNVFSTKGISKGDLDKALFEYRQKRREKTSAKEATSAATATASAPTSEKAAEVKNEPARKKEHTFSYEDINSDEFVNAINEAVEALNNVKRVFLGHGRKIVKNSLIDLLMKW